MDFVSFYFQVRALFHACHLSCGDPFSLGAVSLKTHSLSIHPRVRAKMHSGFSCCRSGKNHYLVIPIATGTEIYPQLNTLRTLLLTNWFDFRLNLGLSLTGVSLTSFSKEYLRAFLPINKCKNDHWQKNLSANNFKEFRPIVLPLCMITSHQTSCTEAENFDWWNPNPGAGNLNTNSDDPLLLGLLMVVRWRTAALKMSFRSVTLFLI